MRYLILPDLHGQFASLEGLLRTAGAIDREGNRIGDFTVVSIGDLCNAVKSDANCFGDSKCLAKVGTWIDKLIMGNHEMGWWFGPGLSFLGFYDDPANGSLFRKLTRDRLVVPAVLIEEQNLLLSHAGVHKLFDFGTAKEAYRAIMEVWTTTPSSWEKLGTIGPTPKRFLIQGQSKHRGQTHDLAPSIFWKDWREPINKNFSQIVGHTSIKKPDYWTRDDGTFTLNIDCGAHWKKTGATGVVVDGNVLAFIEWSSDKERES